MSQPKWLGQNTLIEMHAEQLALFGGPVGIRDATMLESALMRSQHKYAYGEADLAVLAAAYAYGIARNHPFVDGNKRAAFHAMMVFLGLNGIAFAPPPAHAAAMMLELAAGSVHEDGLIRWIRDTIAAG